MKQEVETLQRRIQELEGQLQALQDSAAPPVSLDSLQRVIRDTGRIAKVGGWHVDLTTGAVTWTNETFDIFELDNGNNNIPAIEDAFAYYPGVSKEIIQTAVQRAIEIGEKYDVVVQFLTAKGNPRWIRTFGEPTWAEGRVVAISGAIQDVTDLKNYELEIEQHRNYLEDLVEQRTQQLQEEKEKVIQAHFDVQQRQELLSMVLNNVDALVYMTDLEGKYLYLNRKAADFLNTSQEQALGKAIHEIIPQVHAEQVTKMDNQALSTGYVQSGEENFLDAGGESRHYWSTKIPILSRSGEVHSLIGISTDITRLSTTDTLTGANNRRVLNIELEKSFSNLKRRHRPFCVILSDIDHFKKINDTHGHLQGDQTLIVVAKHLQSAMRPTDVLGRWGGEEFLMICQETTLEGAGALAERLRQTVERCAQELGFAVSMSLGVAEGQLDDANSQAVVERADQRLYQAKEGGRNRVCC